MRETKRERESDSRKEGRREEERYGSRRNGMKEDIPEGGKTER